MKSRRQEFARRRQEFMKNRQEFFLAGAEYEQKPARKKTKKKHCIRISTKIKTLTSSQMGAEWGLAPKSSLNGRSRQRKYIFPRNFF